MKRKSTSKFSTSDREQQHSDILEAALARPGVREVMIVYGSWLVRDRGLDAYRSATKKPVRIITTNSSNIY